MGSQAIVMHRQLDYLQILEGHAASLEMLLHTADDKAIQIIIPAQ